MEKECRILSQQAADESMTEVDENLGKGKRKKVAKNMSFIEELSATADSF